MSDDTRESSRVHSGGDDDDSGSDENQSNVEEMELEYRGRRLVLLYVNGGQGQHGATSATCNVVTDGSDSTSGSSGGNGDRISFSELVKRSLLDEEDCILSSKSEKRTQASRRSHHLQHHLLRDWFGIRQYFVIAPAAGEYLHDDAGTARLLLSALYIALGNAASIGRIPCFAVVGDPAKCNFIGRWGDTIAEHVNFMCESTEAAIPRFYSTLSGQLDFFSMSIGRQTSVDRSLRIAARYTYDYRPAECSRQSWKHTISCVNKEIPIFLFDIGTLRDPIECIRAIYCWKPFSESTLSTTTHNLNPTKADRLYLERTLKSLKKVECDLSSAVRRFVRMYYESIDEVQSENGMNNDSSQFDGLFGARSSKLRQAILAGHSQSARNQHTELEQQMVQDTLNSIMRFQVDNNPVQFENGLPKASNPGNLISLLAVQAAFLDEWSDVRLLLKMFVAQLRGYVESNKLIPNVPEGHPDWTAVLIEQKLMLLNCCIHQAIQHQTNGGNKSGASIAESSADDVLDPFSNSGWESMDVFELNDDASSEHASTHGGHGIDDDVVDAQTSAAAEDDMVDWENADGWESLDIEEENIDGETLEDDNDKVEAAITTTTTTTTALVAVVSGYCDNSDDNDISDDFGDISHDSDDDTDDSDGLEFFDALDSAAEEISSDISNGTPDQKDSSSVPILIGSNGKPIIIPETQPSVPMTEDMAHQQQEVLSSLGSSDEGSRIRARLQTATLYSDMCSFKDANPDAQFEDFLKWYSPNDVIESQENGQPVTVSARMEQGMWRSTWDRAIPVPARAQKPLFDHVRESQLTLHYFETLGYDEWMKQLLSVVLVIAYYTLRHSSRLLQVDRTTCVGNAFETLKSKLNTTLCLSPVGSSENLNQEDLGEICNLIENIEMMLSFGISIRKWLRRERIDEDNGSDDAITLCSLIDKLWTNNNGQIEIENMTSSSEAQAIVRSLLVRDSSAGVTIPKAGNDDADVVLRDPDSREYIFRIQNKDERGNWSSHRMYTALSRTDGFRASVAVYDRLS